MAADGAGEMADVVQERGRDERVMSAHPLGKMRGLEHVRSLGDRLAQVLGCSLAGEQVSDLPDRVGVRHDRPRLVIAESCQRGASWPATTRRRRGRRSSPEGAGDPDFGHL